MKIDLKEFTKHYLQTLFWSDSTASEMESDSITLSPEAVEAIEEDCKKFLEMPDIQGAINDALEKYDLGNLAHDFCLTRNRHGAGFWDGDLPEETGKILTEAAHSFSEQNLYIGDDGVLYVFG